MDKITIERETLKWAIRWHESRIWPGPDEVSVFDALRAALAAQPAPAAVPPGYVLVPIEPTPEMVAAYLSANTEYWRLVDGFPPKIGVWRNGTPSQATAESYRAMIAAAKRVAPRPQVRPAGAGRLLPVSGLF